MITPRRSLLLATAVTAAAAVTGVATARMLPRADRFDHEQHARLFPSCTSCHAGVQTGSNPWPAATACATCHDGTIERRVDWTPPAGLPRTNLRFDHQRHANELIQRGTITPDSAWRCATCHVRTGARAMQVSLAVNRACLTCHGITTPHLSAPDSACATCHLSLARAVRLTREDVSAFRAPPSHREPAFAGPGHGTQATALRQQGQQVAAACATCHARDFCLQCHVNAPETRAIQALAADARSLAIEAALEAPAPHREPGFSELHGRSLGTGATCATCHTRESCLTCHAGSAPGPVLRLASAGAGRAIGALTHRRRPPTHGADFTDAHAPFARAAARTCVTCHARTECLSCHVPSPGENRGYHPANFLTRHPAAAYARSTNCADCHNTASFCASCHAQSGLRSMGPLRAGYHDANPAFLLGHGKAARQELETCVSCHVERDCLTCHAAVGGRRFNPHGPGFDAERLKRKNPEMCTACHGAAIP
ncbi:MAG TPA: cytochrome c3 family protein [Gemmatimonadales bacterium]|nr:cytochrome c3 family protein [Gemmatimonadales bacterium]